VPPRIPQIPSGWHCYSACVTFHGSSFPAGSFSQFPREDVITEIARCEAEGLLEARLLRGGGVVLDAVALRLKPRGSDWLHKYGAP
jgi:hypothetical protein